MKNINYLITLLIIITLTFCKKEYIPSVYYPLEGLVSYFNFDGNYEDSKNYAHPKAGQTTFINGKKALAIKLNGTTDFLEYDQASFINGANSVSVSFWIQTNFSSKLKYFIFCDDFGCGIFKDTVFMAISLPFTNATSGKYVVGTWAHFVGTFDGTTIKIYINGILASAVLHPGTLSSYNYLFNIGKFNKEFWAGSIDELFIYKKALNQGEVNQLYNIK